MILKYSERKEYFKLYFLIINYVNDKLKIYPEKKNFENFDHFKHEQIVNLRDKFMDNLYLIDRFVKTKKQGLSPLEVDLLKSWKYSIKGNFVVYKQLKKYGLVIDLKDGKERVFGLLGLNDNFEGLLSLNNLPFPRLMEFAIMPFREKLIFDGLLADYSIKFEPEVKNRLKEICDQASKNDSIIVAMTKDGRLLTTGDIKKQQ
jgi:hypothetical protein